MVVWPQRGPPAGVGTPSSFSSLAMGIGNVITGLLAKLLVYGAFSLVYRFRLFTLATDAWWMWVLAFFADDLSYYWFHYVSHNMRWFWASHVVHHSSQRYGRRGWADAAAYPAWRNVQV